MLKLNEGIRQRNTAVGHHAQTERPGTSRTRTPGRRTAAPDAGTLRSRSQKTLEFGIETNALDARAARHILSDIGLDSLEDPLVMLKLAPIAEPGDKALPRIRDADRRLPTTLPLALKPADPGRRQRENVVAVPTGAGVPGLDEPIGLHALQKTVGGEGVPAERHLNNLRAADHTIDAKKLRSIDLAILGSAAPGSSRCRTRRPPRNNSREPSSLDSPPWEGGEGTGRERSTDGDCDPRPPERDRRPPRRSAEPEPVVDERSRSRAMTSSEA